MTILLIRANRNDADQKALSSLGIDTKIDPYLVISAVENPAGVERIRQALKATGNKWLVATSTNSLGFLETAMLPGELTNLIRTQPGLNCAAIGELTEQQLRELGARTVLRAPISDSQSLSNVLGNLEPCPVVIPSSNIAMKSLSHGLAKRGFTLIEEVVYSTNIVTQIPASVAEIAEGKFTGVLLRSPSAARAFAAFNGAVTLPVFCAGRTTSAQAVELGLNVVTVSSDPTPLSVAQSITSYLKEHKS
ncbi:uroporphyrinogen-III synthase [Aurantimicrobium minutum]|uniref:uroporphyrinogen-III synthase n=1 Tax=Aurantimicrobium minutum TaxID=708131 RepID=UPI002404EB3E|nr:uroporphyrinogen-III synthase [Aurantimicrobium minutum]MDF9809802.1 uroporphyrinogen-III synthase [Aurantimicrobium minutum]